MLRAQTVVTLLVAAFVRGLAAQPAVRSSCLRHEPDTVRLTGRLERHMYYGPPNVGEDPAHDEQEVGFYLGLAAPICAKGGRDPEGRSGM
jgi:hypothetical protein